MLPGDPPELHSGTAPCAHWCAQAVALLHAVLNGVRVARDRRYASAERNENTMHRSIHFFVPKPWPLSKLWPSCGLAALTTIAIPCVLFFRWVMIRAMVRVRGMALSAAYHLRVSHLSPSDPLPAAERGPGTLLRHLSGAPRHPCSTASVSTTGNVAGPVIMAY